MGKHFSNGLYRLLSNKQLHRLKNSVTKGITIHTVLFKYLLLMKFVRNTYFYTLISGSLPGDMQQ